MRKVRRTLPIVLGALIVLGILAAAGHAKRPTPPPPEPTLVKVTGGIEIQSADHTADATSARVAFIDPSLRLSHPITDPPT